LVPGGKAKLLTRGGRKFWGKPKYGHFWGGGGDFFPKRKKGPPTRGVFVGEVSLYLERGGLKPRGC